VELWEIEDRIRVKSVRRVRRRVRQLARSVYLANDRRSEAKRRINLATGPVSSKRSSTSTTQAAGRRFLRRLTEQDLAAIRKILVIQLGPIGDAC